MLIAKVRLERKFNLKGKVDYPAAIFQILRVQLVFEAILILVSCTLNLSLHIYPNHLYTCQFWTSEKIANTNLSLAIVCLVILPYLIFYEKGRLFLIRDLIGTCLFMHTLICMTVSLEITLSYIVYAITVGSVACVVGTYAYILTEQKKLIDQIRNIESIDRKERVNLQEMESSQLKHEGHF